MKWIGMARKIRAARAIFGVFAALLLLSSWSAVALATPRIVIVGDSLAAGYGLDPGQSFPARLSEKLAQAGHPIEMIDQGVSGDTSAGGAARIDAALAEHPDAVLLELGANDALRGINPALTAADLHRILDRLQAAHVKVLLLGMQAPGNWGRDYQRQFDAIYPRLAAEFHVPLYPFILDGVALDPKLNQPDLLHPNEAGAELIAGRLVPYVENLLGQAPDR